MMTLYGYWRSSASYRVRIALSLKGIEVRYVPVDLRAGAQFDAVHTERNPQPFVPVLELEDGTRLTQSVAILDYLEESYPAPALLPEDKVLRARIRAAAYIISADISPIQNLRVLKFIRAEHGQDSEGVKSWAKHWIGEGFKGLERIASEAADEKERRFLLTDEPGYFECCLIPQIYNARRFGLDMSNFPRLLAIDEACSSLPAFVKALPEQQVDATDSA